MEIMGELELSKRLWGWWSLQRERWPKRAHLSTIGKIVRMRKKLISEICLGQFSLSRQEKRQLWNYRLRLSTAFFGRLLQLSLQRNYNKVFKIVIPRFISGEADFYPLFCQFWPKIGWKIPYLTSCCLWRERSAANMSDWLYGCGLGNKISAGLGKASKPPVTESVR